MKELIYSKEDLDLILSIELQNQEQEIERLKNIIKEAKEWVEKNKYYFPKPKELEEILDKGVMNYERSKF